MESQVQPNECQWKVPQPFSKVYGVSMELAGPFAVFRAFSDTGGIFSYSMPTFQAAFGIFASVDVKNTVYIHPTEVRICSPVRRMTRTENYTGPNLNKQQMKSGTGQQTSEVLVDVCFQLFGEVRFSVGLEQQTFNQVGVRFNNRHFLQEHFNRRLKRGQCHHTPFLGSKDFVPTYWGPIRTETKVQTDVNETIPLFMMEAFSLPWRGKDGQGVFSPRIIHNAEIRKGVFFYDK